MDWIWRTKTSTSVGANASLLFRSNSWMGLVVGLDMSQVVFANSTESAD